MSKKLRATYLTKEKAELFLSNLERLKNEESITEDQYGVLKSEYTKMREDAIFKINSIKVSLRKKLHSKTSKLEPFRVKLDYLESRFKVGQIPANAYYKQEKSPKRKVAELEKQISDLKALINSTCSADIGGPKGTNLVDTKLTHRVKQVLKLKSEVIADTSIIKTPEVKQVLKPESASMADTNVIETPEAKQVAPDIVHFSDLQIMPDRVTQGSSVGILITISNTSQSPVCHKVELKINGKVTDSREVTLASGSSQEVTFVATAGVPGDYQVEVADSTGRFSVMPVANKSH